MKAISIELAVPRKTDGVARGIEVVALVPASGFAVYVGVVDGATYDIDRLELTEALEL